MHAIWCFGKATVCHSSVAHSPLAATQVHVDHFSCQCFRWPAELFRLAWFILCTPSLSWSWNALQVGKRQWGLSAWLHFLCITSIYVIWEWKCEGARFKMLYRCLCQFFCHESCCSWSIYEDEHVNGCIASMIWVIFLLPGMLSVQKYRSVPVVILIFLLFSIDSVCSFLKSTWHHLALEFVAHSKLTVFKCFIS